MHEIIRRQTENIIRFLQNQFEFSDKWATKTGQLIMLILLIIISYLAYRVTVKLMRKILIPILNRTKNQFDDLLLKHHFFRNIAFLVPALLLYYFIEDTITGIPIIYNTVKALLEVLFVLIVLLFINSILNTINDYYERYDFAKDHPIKSVIQIIKIVAAVIGLIVIIGSLLNKDITSIILSMGAVSAVFMLIFKDPILGFVGGLQLIFNKMLSIGDWISMPKFGADGVVKDISLTTVKVQNWDKTIVYIPIYSLVSDSFRNWRGMQQAGARRIKRAVYIDQHSIRFCTPEMLERFRKIKVLREYIEKTEEEIEAYNAKHQVDPEILVNGRRQTNIGVFRAYLKAYLANRSDINKNLTFMVRHLPPSEKGLPVEIYVFATTTEWVAYEGIMADIFDHVLAVVPQFDLRIYQYPTGKFPAPAS